MSTIWFGQDVDGFAAELKKALADRDAELVITTGIHGTISAGSKRTPMLRVPVSFAADCLKHPDCIPTGKTMWLGVMILPKHLAAPPPEESDESTAEGVSEQ